MIKIPQANPLALAQEQDDEIQGAIRDVLASGWYILGPQVEAFESELATYLGGGHAVGVGSGTDALHLALRGLEIGPGDEVIAPTHTAVATVAAIEMSGATPHLVDVDQATYTIDPAAVEAAIGSRTKAIVAVHLYGQAADLDAIGAIARRHSLAVIEDCAQAAGASFGDRRLGSIGDVAAFSFYPTKNLAAIGDGGMVVCRDPAVAERVRLLRAYGWKQRNVSEIAGWNSRLDELQAAILRVRLRHLDHDNDRRRSCARQLRDGLAGVDLPIERAGATHVYHLYVVRHAGRDALMARLREHGVGTAVHYPVPVHLQPAYRGRLGDAGDHPVAERLVGEILSLPLYPQLTSAELKHVIDAVGICAPLGG